MPEHTPGDWHLHETKEDGAAYEVHAEYVNGALGKKHHCVAKVGDMRDAERFGNIGDAEGNAHLIVAAPDMLAALREWAKCKHRPGLCDDCEHWVSRTGACAVESMVEAAIVKAMG